MSTDGLLLLMADSSGVDKYEQERKTMSFEITLLPSGHKFRADEKASLLTSGLAAGLFLPYSCRQGSCGTCRGRIAHGSVAYGEVLPPYLSDEDRARGGVLLCQATAQSDLVIELKELEGLGGIRTRITPCRVTAVERPSDDVAVLRVRLPMNENLRFLAGQYVDFLVDGVRRSFSIATAPTTAGVTELEFHLKQLPSGKFSDHVFNHMRLREILRLEGPLGTFFIRSGDKPIILCATGTGFAPIKSMLMAAFSEGLHERRQLSFYWGARTREGLYAFDAVREWAAQYGFRFQPVVSGPADPNFPEARQGYIQDAILEDFPDLSLHEMYACGSPAMVNALRSAAQTQRRLPADAFFSDEFLPASPAAAEIPETPNTSGAAL